jgi:hypothetical protein
MSSITPPVVAGAMKKMGWPVASALMKRWSDGAAWTMPDTIKLGKADPSTLPATQLDDTIVKVSWLLKFPRVKTAYDQVIASALSENAIKILRERLASAGWKSGAFSLGSTTMNARTLERTCQTNFIQLGSLSDTIDEFYGAIGKASFKVAAIGTVAIGANKQHVFNVDKLGVYLRDTYDFNGFQPLGVWSKDRCLSKVESAAYYADEVNKLNPNTWPGRAIFGSPFDGFESFSNATARSWRDTSGKGGDFVIYSDVVWLDSAVKQVAL